MILLGGKWWKIPALVLGAGVSLFLAAVVAYEFSPGLLTVDSGRSVAGAIVVLGGDPVGRPARAAELFKAGEAPQIIVSGDGDWNEVKTNLLAKGVPEKAIVIEGESRTTKENAEFSVAILRQAGLTNAIIVTSWYHSRRAVNCFRQAAPEIQFYSRPCYGGLNRKEWAHNGVGVHIRMEYWKLFGYWVRYGVCPF